MISFATISEPSAITATRQVARWWREVFNDLAFEHDDDPLVFVEPSAHEPGHVYAGPLPQAESRLSPACSIVPGPSGGRSSSYESRATITLLCESRATTHTQAVEMLQSLRRCVRRAPTDAGFAAPHARNIVGAPTLDRPGGANTRVDLWRFLSLDVLAEPQPIAIADDAATGEREAAATMTLVATVVPVTVESVFSLRATNANLGEAFIDADGAAIEILRDPDDAETVFASIPLAGKTLAQVIADINAGVLTHGVIAEHAAEFAAPESDTPASTLLGFFTRTLAVGGSTVVVAER